MSKEVIIIKDETIAQSWKRDASSYALIVAVIGTGVLMDSAAMQWIGFLCIVVVALARGSALRKNNTKTISEARAFLDRLEAEGK
jgi:hypothetical protein